MASRTDRPSSFASFLSVGRPLQSLEVGIRTVEGKLNHITRMENGHFPQRRCTKIVA